MKHVENMLTLDLTEIKELIDSEIKKDDDFFCLAAKDFARMKDLAGNPFAAIVTSCSNSVISLADELYQSVISIDHDGIMGICIQIHSIDFKMRELSNFMKAVSSYFGRNNKIKIGIIQDPDLPTGARKLVAVLYAKV